MDLRAAGDLGEGGDGRSAVLRFFALEDCLRSFCSSCSLCFFCSFLCLCFCFFIKAAQRSSKAFCCSSKSSSYTMKLSSETLDCMLTASWGSIVCAVVISISSDALAYRCATLLFLLRRPLLPFPKLPFVVLKVSLIGAKGLSAFFGGGDLVIKIKNQNQQ